MNWQALLLGAASFLIIGLFHPLVIKGEYYFGKGIWPLFLATGLVFISGGIVDRSGRAWEFSVYSKNHIFLSVFSGRDHV